MATLLGIGMNARFFFTIGDISADGVRYFFSINNTNELKGNQLYSSITYPSLNIIPGGYEFLLLLRVIPYCYGSNELELIVAERETRLSHEPAKVADRWIFICFPRHF